jgi:hypothetical protein
MDYFKSCFDQMNIFDGIVAVIALVLLSGIATLMLFNVHAGFSLSLVLVVILLALLVYLIVSSYRPEAVKNIYIFGIMIWATTFMVFVSLYRSLFPKLDLWASLITKSNIFYLIPVFACFITLWWNLRLQAMEKESAKGDYEGEVKLLKFVERSGFYIILSVIALLLFLGTDMVRNIRHFNLSPFFYFWMISAIAIQVCGVLPLVWAAGSDAKRVAWARHFKTVWYTISVYVLLFGIVALGKSLIPHAIGLFK